MLKIIKLTNNFNLWFHTGSELFIIVLVTYIYPSLRLIIVYGLHNSYPFCFSNPVAPTTIIFK